MKNDVWKILIVCLTIAIIFGIFILAVKVSYSVGYQDGEDAMSTIIMTSLQTKHPIGILTNSTINPIIKEVVHFIVNN